MGYPGQRGLAFQVWKKARQRERVKAYANSAENVTFVPPEDTKHVCGEGQSHSGIGLKNVLVFILFFNTRLISSESLVKGGACMFGGGVG